MFFKKHKSSKDVPPAKTQRIEPPTRIARDGGTRIFNCEPPKGSKPNPPRRQYGVSIIPPVVTMLRIITKDEFILRELKKCNPKRQQEIWQANSKGYNFCFLDASGEYYSVDYINKLLER